MHPVQLDGRARFSPPHPLSLSAKPRAFLTCTSLMTRVQVPQGSVRPAESGTPLPSYLRATGDTFM